MKVRVTATYKSVRLIEVADDFDPEHSDLHPEEFESEMVSRLNHDGALTRGTVFAEYDFA